MQNNNVDLFSIPQNQPPRMSQELPIPPQNNNLNPTAPNQLNTSLNPGQTASLVA